MSHPRPPVGERGERVDADLHRALRARRVPPRLPLILGVGNLLLGDDGVGLHLLGLLSREAEHWHVGIEFVDGGAHGLMLLGSLSGRPAVILLDAVTLGAPPGTVHVLCAEQALALGRRPSRTVHEGGAARLLAIASLTGDLPPLVRVVGIEPGRVELCVGLSDAVRAAIPEALRRAREAIAELLVVVEDRRHLELAAGPGTP